MALDPSKGRDGKTGDYSAFVMLMWTADGTLYVDADLDVRHTSSITATALEIVHSFQPDGFAVETNQFQELLADDLLRQAEERRMIINLFGANNQVPKVVRIRRLTALLSQGRIRFKTGSPSAKLLVDQLRDFPSGDHDDGPDALEMAVRLAQQLMHAPDDEVAFGLVYSG